MFNSFGGNVYREGSWGCGEWCSSVGGGGTKRRGKSPDWAESKLRHRIGKVRRCSTEYDLYSATSHDSQTLHHGTMNASFNFFIST